MNCTAPLFLSLLLWPITLSDCIVLFHLLSSDCKYWVWEREILCTYSKIGWTKLKKSVNSLSFLLKLFNFSRKKSMFTSLSWQTEGKMAYYTNTVSNESSGLINQLIISQPATTVTQLWKKRKGRTATSDWLSQMMHCWYTGLGDQRDTCFLRPLMWVLLLQLGAKL